MKHLIKVSSLSLLFLASIGAANNVDFNVSLGAAFSKLSNNSTVTPTSGLTKTYTADESTQVAPFFGIGGEYTFNHLSKKPLAVSLGLSAYYVDLGKISGTEVPGSNMGLTDTLNYSMKANSLAFLLEPRFIYTSYRVQPYLLLGAGYALNTLNNFKETTPAGSHAVPSNPYGSHTQGEFAYELGAGLQYPFTIKHQHCLLRLDYHYLNVGDAALGAANGQTTNERLRSNNVSTNIISLGLSYLF